MWLQHENVKLDGAGGQRHRMPRETSYGSADSAREARFAVRGDVMTQFHFLGGSLIFNQANHLTAATFSTCSRDRSSIPRSLVLFSPCPFSFLLLSLPLHFSGALHSLSA
jgi:hypothetical protein